MWMDSSLEKVNFVTHKKKFIVCVFFSILLPYFIFSSIRKTVRWGVFGSYAVVGQWGKNSGWTTTASFI